jgi:hypothetical protein
MRLTRRSVFSAQAMLHQDDIITIRETLAHLCKRDEGVCLGALAAETEHIPTRYGQLADSHADPINE